MVGSTIRIQPNMLNKDIIHDLYFWLHSSRLNLKAVLYSLVEKHFRGHINRGLKSLVLQETESLANILPLKFYDELVNKLRGTESIRVSSHQI